MGSVCASASLLSLASRFLVGETLQLTWCALSRVSRHPRDPRMFAFRTSYRLRHPLRSNHFLRTLLPRYGRPYPGSLRLWLWIYLEASRPRCHFPSHWATPHPHLSPIRYFLRIGLPSRTFSLFEVRGTCCSNGP